MPYVSHSVEETQQLARAISERVQPGDVILLVGANWFCKKVADESLF